MEIAMATDSPNVLKGVLQHEQELLESWVSLQLAATTRRGDLMKDTGLRQESAEFLKAFRQGVEGGDMERLDAPAWGAARELVAEVSRARGRQGFTPSETAMFVLSLKQPLFRGIQNHLGHDSEAIAAEFWRCTVLLDRLALLTAESYQKGREEVISRQQHELLELSTPVVKLWEGILALPLIGTLDSERTQIVMESLLQQIVPTGASIAPEACGRGRSGYPAARMRRCFRGGDAGHRQGPRHREHRAQFSGRLFHLWHAGHRPGRDFPAFHPARHLLPTGSRDGPAGAGLAALRGGGQRAPGGVWVARGRGVDGQTGRARVRGRVELSGIGWRSRTVDRGRRSGARRI